MPSTNPETYGFETAGDVFRYSNGSVSQAQGYYWSRPQRGTMGYITRFGTDGNPNGWPTPYKTQSVFACSPLLPLVVVGVDPSVDQTYVRRWCGCDPPLLPTNDEDDGTANTWFTLHFSHPQGDGPRGVSQARLRGQGRSYVVGEPASWIPSLVPEQYRNTRGDESIRPSVGLSGELPLVIALMAFSDRKSRNRLPGDVFKMDGGRWQHRRWTGHGPARGCKASCFIAVTAAAIYAVTSRLPWLTMI